MQAATVEQPQLGPFACPRHAFKLQQQLGFASSSLQQQPQHSGLRPPHLPKQRSLLAGLLADGEGSAELPDHQEQACSYDSLNPSLCSSLSDQYSPSQSFIECPDNPDISISTQHPWLLMSSSSPLEIPERPQEALKKQRDQLKKIVYNAQLAFELQQQAEYCRVNPNMAARHAGNMRV